MLDFDITTASDKELNDAWRRLGLYKWRLRQLLFDVPPVKLKDILPRLNKANEWIDRIWDELFNRQSNPKAFARRHQGEKLNPSVSWHLQSNPLRWSGLPSVFPWRD